MNWVAAVPDWLVWCAASGVGVLALASVAGVIQVALDLDAR